MHEDDIDRLLAGTYPDPEGGGALCAPTRSVRIDDTLEGLEAEAVRGLDLGSRLAVVSDATTHAVLGDRVERALAAAWCVDSVVLPERPRPDMDTVERVRAATTAADALIAVGSGTINDLCKCASARDGKPYAVFGTAPSMNGYTAANAAITVHGHKKSLPAQVPAGVFLDLRILCAAPARMIRSGLGDSLCRSTAQADWLLAHLLLDEPYREAPYALLAADEEALFAESAALLAGDRDAMRRLARTLVLSGLGMTLCASSRPASGGEHLISHYLDMMSPPQRPQFFHGEQVGVATLTVATLQERMLEGGPPRIGATVTGRDEVIAHFGPEMGRDCWEELAPKRIDGDAVDAFNERLDARWDAIRERIAAVARPAAALREVLAGAAARRTHADIGADARLYGDAVMHARELRNRYTFLDLGADACMLDEVIPG
ncbi:MAG: sn-glycerol-1-phosphate dehydrogenase [Gammaproteobacteria bacterium]|nr:sn-glycerol-1-phosphate dehydrogenase [Gammaproteobacteria bacterium]NIR81762.1 sn-glycerol-1-phosphate dehydrogenase [Gammaproteobacteria bacterium]NIR88565.1 sn-glycerol-1-phosphate dehydrogenase [Gammaproteobacteria bacterium]NIU02869.1 sn-glycerol-1-phosphate dehydrogenase [Gammaproteobacteria bacterium]NIV50391.1 iron-containing alcohol dehydrogenase [Gammaproteobacteria bacterium]